MATPAQRSFAGGEVSPSIYPRCDTVKYMTGARKLRNMVVRKHGGAMNRAGTSFVCETRYSDRKSRLIPFRHTDDLTFAIEVGHLYMRGVQDGQQIRQTAKVITGITQANPAVVTSNTHGYDNGDEVHIDNVVGMTQLNGRNFIVANKTTNTFELKYLDGTNVNSTAFGAYTSGGTSEEVHEIIDTTGTGLPLYSEDEIFDVQYAQNDDTVTMTHQDHPIREVSASTPTLWTNLGTDLLPTLPYGPTGGIGVAGAGGSKTFKYVVTVVTDEFEESLANLREDILTITTASNANPVSITVTGHPYATGDVVYISKLQFASQLVQGYYTITKTGANTFTIPVNTTAGGAFSSANGAYRDVITIHAAADPTASAPNVISWDAYPDPSAKEYNIYKEKQGIFCFHGSTTNTSYNDEGGNGDPLENPPELRRDLNDTVTPNANTYPAVVGTIQQRRVFANTKAGKQTGWASKSTFPNNYTLHFPLVDDDSVKFRLAGDQNSIRHVLDLGSIIVLTTGGEWVLQGDAGGILTPTQVNPKQFGYNGSSKIKPLLINNNALFVQATQNIVRDLRFDFSVDGYQGNDLTIFASHLFEGHQVVDWAYQKTPNSIVWAVRSDGVLLGFTYLKEQEILAWHQHDMDGGLVESVCTIPEGDEDALYLIVKREIGGVTKRYIERMNTRSIREDNIKDGIFMDCAKSYDGRHTGSTTMQLSGGTTWSHTETLTLTASAPAFSASDVGNQVQLTDVNGEEIRFTITAYNSTTEVEGHSNKIVPAIQRVSPTGAGQGEWALAIKVLTELWHLEGEQVSIFGDGYVVASPYNDSYGSFTVTNGQVTLNEAYAVLHVGLPYVSDLETLSIDTAQGETLVDKKMAISSFTAWLENSRTFFSGPKPPEEEIENESGNILFNLFETKLRAADSTEYPVLFTGTKEDLIKPNWDNKGRVFIRNIDPVPLTVAAIAPNGTIPFRGA